MTNKVFENMVQQFNMNDLSPEALRELDKKSPFEITEDISNEYCAVAAFFENERKAGRDTSVAMISCNCSRCSPRM